MRAYITKANVAVLFVCGPHYIGRWLPILCRTGTTCATTCWLMCTERNQTVTNVSFRYCSLKPIKLSSCLHYINFSDFSYESI